MVKINDVEIGLAAYLDNEIFTQIKADEKLKKYGMTVAGAVAVKSAVSALRKLENSPLIAGMGIINGDEINAELLLDTMKEKMPEEGIKTNIPVLGSVTFGKEDVDMLKRYIVREE